MATTASRHSYQRPSFLPWSPASSGKTPAAAAAATAAPAPAATPPSDPVRLPPSPATTPREATMATMAASVSASANGSGAVDAEATPKGASTARMSSSPTRNSFGPSLDGNRGVPVPATAARPTRARADTSATVTSPSVRVRPPSASPDDTDPASDDDYHSAMPALSTRPTTRSKRRPHTHTQAPHAKHRPVIAVPLVVLRARRMAPSADALVKIQAQYGGIPLPVRDEHLTLCLDVCAEMEKGDDLVEQAAAKAFLDQVYGSTQQTPDDVAGRVDALTAQVADLAGQLHVSWAGQELLRLRLEMLELKYDGAASGSNSTLGRGPGLAHADTTLTDGDAGPSKRSRMVQRPDVAALAARVDMLDGVLNGLRSNSTSPPRPPTPTLFGFTPTRLPKLAPPKPRPSSLPARAAPLERPQAPPPGTSPLRQHVAHHYSHRDAYAYTNGNRHLYPSASDTDTDTDTVDTASHVSFGSLDIPAETPLPANLVIWVCSSCRLHNPDWEKGSCQFCSAARPGSSGRASGQSTGESEDLEDIEEEE